MSSLANRILQHVQNFPGATDRHLAEALFGPGTPQQRVNGECRLLASKGQLQRRPRPDGLIGNYIGSQAIVDPGLVSIIRNRSHNPSFLKTK